MNQRHQQLKKHIDLMSDVRILIIGDVMLDMYEWCDVRRISPEAPVPIATVTGESFFLGGAGNVAHNAQALGARVSLVSVVGDDTEGALIARLLREKNIESDGLVVEENRQTTLKKRIVSGSQQLLRIDREVTSDISDATRVHVQSILLEKIIESDVIVLSDYCKGVLGDEIVSFVLTEAKKVNKKIFVDSKSSRLPRYSGVFVIKPNKSEAEHFAGEKFLEAYTNLEAVGHRLSQTLNANIVITLGGDGIATFENGNFNHHASDAQQVFDVSGAGDTVLSVLAVAVGTGANLNDAVQIANKAAGHVVGCLGTAVCEQDVLKGLFNIAE